ncbi:hypothetical protein [uncultured Mediterranean phage]|nr:hypothetical protein [uncultured Mediterranean phage]|tara:strand:- start:137 stop:454 length:318 start_codon:yes stop_codon:yes gene_type:complete
MRVILAILLIFLTLPAVAQVPMCGEYAVIKNAINRQQETLTYRGISENGMYLTEIFINNNEDSNGGFTIIISKANATEVCVVFSGFGFNDVRGDTPWRGPIGKPS